MLLRLALRVADRVVTALPGRVAWWLADRAGDTWRRGSASRRRLVRAQLARVCAATGRPTSGPALEALVRAAFRHHARYYVEILRTPHYPLDEIDGVVDVPDWPEYEAALRGRASMLVSWHLGNFEPFGIFLAARGLRPLAPIEEIRPRELYDFLAERRGGGGVDLVTLAEARRPLTRRLREDGLVAIIGDRDLAGGGQPITLFGHPTTVPTGPASLAITHGAAVVAGRCLRTGPDRFHAAGEVLDVPSTGSRRADIATLTERIARRFEADVAAAPEQWWGAFQPFWPDIAPDGTRSA